MSLNTIQIRLALVLALATLAPACNNQKTADELAEEEGSESFSEEGSTRNNRDSQSGDAAFIKIYPDGDVIPSRGATSTVSAPSASTGSSVADPTDPAIPEDQTPAPPAPAAGDEDNTIPAPGEETVGEPEPTPPAPEPVSNEPVPEPVVINEPAPLPAPQPRPAPAPAPAPSAGKLVLDPSRPTLEINEHTTASIIAIMPKANLSIVSIGKHHQFVPGPYAIMAKWTTSKKVNVKVNLGQDKDCAIDESEVDSEWKTLGIFHLTKNAQIKISNKDSSNYNVQNDFILKPVIAEKLNKPAAFTCLGGQVQGHTLKEFQ
jgi:outer membrane biosynthesis protein TonB